MRMLPIAAGQFPMGSATAKENRWDEAPVHEVRINDPFYISASEVTIEQFLKFRPEFSGSLIEAPAITGVCWQDAVDFCVWLSRKEGKRYRLPTEAEWEYSARAGTDTPFWCGQEPPAPALPNPWGLLGVHSGPAEWCLDWHGPYP